MFTNKIYDFYKSCLLWYCTETIQTINCQCSQILNNILPLSVQLHYTLHLGYICRIRLIFISSNKKKHGASVAQGIEHSPFTSESCLMGSILSCGSHPTSYKLMNVMVINVMEQTIDIIDLDC